MYLKIPGEEPEGEPRKLKESHTAGSLTQAIVFQERGGAERKLLEHSLGAIAWLSSEPRLQVIKGSNLEASRHAKYFSNTTS